MITGLQFTDIIRVIEGILAAIIIGLAICKLTLKKGIDTGSEKKQYMTGQRAGEGIEF